MRLSYYHIFIHAQNIYFFYKTMVIHNLHFDEIQIHG